MMPFNAVFIAIGGIGMLKTCFILALLALTGADAACNCYIAKDSNVTGLKIGLSNAFDDANFEACYVTGGCGFTAYSGDATKGWTSITLNFGTTPADPTGRVTIYRGFKADPNAELATYSTSDSGVAKSFSSPTPYIYVLYTQNDTTKPNTYFGNVLGGSPLQAQTTTLPPTTTGTMAPFNSTVFAKNPLLISHDLLILVNQRTSQGAAGLNALTNMVTTFVNQLSVTTNPIGTTSTRLGLATLTPYTPNYAAQGEIWSMSANDVINALPKSGVSSDVDIANALTSVVNAFFDVANPTAPTRKNVQRSVLLFTAWWNTDDLSSVQGAFAAKGVNLAVVSYNTLIPSLNPNSWYNYAALTNATDQDVFNLMNAFYLNSNMGNTLTNNWCKKGSDPSITLNNVITEPSDYNGPKKSSSTSWSSTDGQTGRYCNFQDTTYTYKRSNPAKNVQVTIFYELEVEQDYLRIYADGVEIESFTGMDVNQANFVVNATVVTAKFTTDSSGVLRGFSATFDEV